MHTRHSWDGIIRPEKLVDALVDQRIQLAVVSDHDSFQGSLECRAIVAERGLALKVPVAAEVRTDNGDVIVVFDDDDDVPDMAELKTWDTLPDAVRSRNGLIWLPHPYQSHNFIEELAEGADVIEIFNARCSEEQNRQAVLLCERHDRVPAYGADVHRPGEVGGCVVEYVEKETITETLRHGPTPIVTNRTSKSEIMAAEVANGIKRRRPALTVYMALRWMQHRYREEKMSRSEAGAP